MIKQDRVAFSDTNALSDNLIEGDFVLRDLYLQREKNCVDV